MHFVRQLHHSFGERPTFFNLSLSVEQGECVALLGESGCGKTTLLRCIAGLESPAQGEITINGQLVFSADRCVATAQRRIGFVFQEYALFPSLNVSENIAFGLRHPDPDRISSLLQLIGLLDHAEHFPHQLSGGQQQRVALARALAPRPKLLLLDEPFANVDAQRRAVLGEELRRILNAENTSALFVTHDQLDALSLSDRVAVMARSEQGGYIAQCDKPEMVYTSPETPEVAALTGTVWLVPATSNGMTARSSFGSIPLQRPLQGDVLVAVRPEHMAFHVGTGEHSVDFCACLGSHFQLTIRSADQTIRLFHDHSLATGTSGRLVFEKPSWGWEKASLQQKGLDFL